MVRALFERFSAPLSGGLNTLLERPQTTFEGSRPSSNDLERHSSASVNPGGPRRLAGVAVQPRPSDDSSPLALKVSQATAPAQTPPPGVVPSQRGWRSRRWQWADSTFCDAGGGATPEAEGVSHQPVFLPQPKSLAELPDPPPLLIEAKLGAAHPNRVSHRIFGTGSQVIHS